MKNPSHISKQFKDMVTGRVDGRNLAYCLQCATCNTCCPVRSLDKSFNPKEMVHRVLLAEENYFSQHPEIPYYCLLCKLCQEVCPLGLKVDEMILAIRGQLVAEKVGPLPQHQKVIADQEWVTSDSFALTLPDLDTGKCERFFFPGCTLSARSPELVMMTLTYLQENLPGTGIILGCCGAPSNDIGNQKRFLEIIDGITASMSKFGASELVIACPECYHTFKHNAPDITLRSVYEIMVERGVPKVDRASGDKTFAIHDSCKTRYESEIQDAIRILVRELGYRIEEMENSRDLTRCCGMGGMVPFVNLKLWNAISRRRASETPHDIITYCSACQESLGFTGKPTVHILDLFFNPNGKGSKPGIPLSKSARQENQSRLKSQLTAMNSKVLGH